MKPRLVNLAFRAARMSDHDFRMGAVIAKKNRVFSFGFNKKRTHTKSTNYLRTIHAELDAMLGVALDQLEGATLYVVRLTRAGEWGTSHPCQFCYATIQKVGIAKIVYINDDRKIHIKKVI